MTEALDAMVKAMVAEIERQIEAGEATLVVGNHDTPETPAAVQVETLDMEKVARAGLEAINAANEREADAIRALQSRYLNTMDGEEARRLNEEVHRRTAALLDNATRSGLRETIIGPP